jgi:hypothetical protein
VKFGNPLLTSELSGSLGGVVASKARGGLGYFRVRARPGNPRTAGQTIMRSILASLAIAWRLTLTGVQRAGWEAAAAEGSSGIDRYVLANSQLLLAGQPRVNTAPTTAFAPAPIVSAVVLDESAATIGFDIPLTNTGFVNVYATRGQSASRAARQFNYLYVGTTVEDDTGPVTVAIPSTHPAGDAAVGQIVYIRLVTFDGDGNVVTGQEFRVTVTA